MKKTKNILSIILLGFLLITVGSAATQAAVLMNWFIAAPSIIAVWAGLALLGVTIYEKGK